MNFAARCGLLVFFLCFSSDVVSRERLKEPEFSDGWLRFELVGDELRKGSNTFELTNAEENLLLLTDLYVALN
jgi:hypothetical protein